MAKSNKNNTAEQITNILTDAKRNVIIGTWFFIVIFVLFVIGKFLIKTETSIGNDTQISDSDSFIEALQEIGVPDSIPNQIVKYSAYTVYYNPKHHEPNASVYELTPEETKGNQPRFNDFLHDDNVTRCPNAWDYSYSGYDRGHMTPAGDMKWDAKAMQESFYMTNICPQDRQLNAEGWSKLENKIREWVRRDGAYIIVTGPIFGQNMKQIGKQVKVSVPKAFFKVILTTQTSKRRAIAFIYPNDQGACDDALRNHAVSVDEVERITGLDFFAALDDDEENEIEKDSNYYNWEVRKR